MSNTINRNADVLVIGTDMAGLSAAAALQKAGRKPLLVDKGRGVGGRLATRRDGATTFDHGAQFVTARDVRFEAVLEKACAAGSVVEWCRGFAAEADGYPRWHGNPGMSALAKFLAAGLGIIQNKQVATHAPDSMPKGNLQSGQKDHFSVSAST